MTEEKLNKGRELMEQIAEAEATLSGLINFNPAKDFLEQPDFRHAIERVLRSAPREERVAFVDLAKTFVENKITKLQKEFGEL